MAFSQVGICNVALIALGAETISSITETTDQAKACNIVWDQARQQVLRAHPWNFAIRTVELGQITTNDRVWRYDYAYQLPSDIMRLLTVRDDFDYKVESGKLYTNKEDCFIKYVKDVTDITKWDGVFAAAMSAKIQEKIAFSITRDQDDVDMARQKFLEVLFQAQTIDASEDIEDQFRHDESLIDVRFGRR